MVTDGDYTDHGEHWVIYRTLKSLYWMPENNIVCQLCFKKKKKRKDVSDWQAKSDTFY